MMSYDKYKRGHQYLNEGHQRITYQKKKKKPEKFTLRLTKGNQSVRMDHAARIQLLISLPND